MALVVTDSQHYNDIADAIRSKNGKSTEYYPSEMAQAIRAISTGGGGGSTDDEDALPVMEVPAEYLEYVEYARENLYSGEFAELVVWDSGEWVAVSFLMPDFEITEYDPYSTEIKATGWFTCGYTKSTGEWTSHDYRNTVSPGGNYAKYIKFASCPIEYEGEKLFPVPVLEEIKTKSVVYDDTANKVTLTMVTGYVETLTFAFDASGNPVSYTDSSGHVTTLEGVTLGV